MRCFDGACGYATTSSVEIPTSEPPVPRAMPCAAAIATRRPVKEPGPVATATRSTSARLCRAPERTRSIVGKSSSPWRRCACHVSSASTPRPSYSATEAHAVDVSSAKRLMEPPQQLRRTLAGRREDDAPLRLGDVLEVDIDAVGRQIVAGAIGPFDDREPLRLEHLLPAGRAEVLSFEAVQVEMEEREPAAVMLVKDHEGRARHGAAVQAEACRDALGELRLTCAELAPQREDVPRGRESCEPLADALGVKRRVADEIQIRAPIAARRPESLVAAKPLRARLFGICGAQG